MLERLVKVVFVQLDDWVEALGVLGFLASAKIWIPSNNLDALPGGKYVPPGNSQVRNSTFCFGCGGCSLGFYLRLLCFMHVVLI